MTQIIIENINFGVYVVFFAVLTDTDRIANDISHSFFVMNSELVIHCHPHMS